MADKKYILINPACEIGGKLLYQIKAIKDFGDVKAGDLGGFIEKEDNLSHEGNAWVQGNARVYDNASILWVSKIGSRLGTTIVFKNKDGGISVSCGCFFGTLKEFEAQVEETHGNNKYGREYKVLIELIKVHFGLEKITDEE